MNSADLKREDRFLTDPDKISIYIKCIACKKRIWRQDVLKRLGEKVASTHTMKAGDHKVEFTNRITNCPMCERKFFVETNKGAQMYLIEDANTGVTRII